MSYKYFYRIKYERATGNFNEWATGSITEQFRNAPLASRDFKLIRWHIFDEMDAFDATEVRACIYRISSSDCGLPAGFDGTETLENRDLDHICGCYVPLVSIVHTTKSLFSTHYGWFDCGISRRNKYCGHMVFRNRRG